MWFVRPVRWFASRPIVFSGLQPEQIWLAINDKNNDVPPRALVAALFQLSRTPVDRSRDLSPFLTRLKTSTEHFRGRDISTIFVACKRFGVTDTNFWYLMRKRVREVHTELNAQEISNILNALSSSRDVENSLLDELGTMVVKNIDAFTPQNIANTLHAIAKFHLRDPTLLQALYSAALQKASSFSATDVSIVLDALGKLDCSNTELVARFCEEGLRSAAQFTPQGIANSLRTLQKLKAGPKLAQRLTERVHESLPQFNLEEIATALKALTALQTVDDKLLNQMADAALRRTRELGSLSVLSLLIALASLKTPPQSVSYHQLLNRLYLEALRHVPQLSPAQVAEMSSAVTRLGVYDSLLLEQLWQRSVQCAPDFSAKEIVDILNCILHFNVFCQPVVHALCRQPLKFSPGEIAVVLYTIAKFSPHRTFTEAVRHLTSQIPQSPTPFTAAEAVTALYSLTTLQQLDLALYEHLRGDLLSQGESLSLSAESREQLSWLQLSLEQDHPSWPPLPSQEPCEPERVAPALVSALASLELPSQVGALVRGVPVSAVFPNQQLALSSQGYFRGVRYLTGFASLQQRLLKGLGWRLRFVEPNWKTLPRTQQEQELAKLVTGE